MDKKILGVAVGVAIVIAIAAGVMNIPESEIPIEKVNQKVNEKIGLVINSPKQATTLQDLDEIYSKAASTGIGRSNVYLFWNLIEPERGEFDWSQSDILMSFNKQNNLKVTLYFSIINGETLGPFPYWIGNPPIQSIGEYRLVSALDAILSRYDIVDTVILAGDTESQFRHYEQNIPVYKEFFNQVYDKTKEKHPDVKIGNSFALHNVLNKDLGHIVSELSLGDFVAFSYSPVNVLNEIVKTPQEAKDELNQIFDFVDEKRIGIFEISWSASDFVGGDDSTQVEFLEKSFEFYAENESDLEFFTWYRQFDKPEGTCITAEQEIEADKLTVGGFANSDHVIERLNHYICGAGLITSEGTPKPSWNKFKNQIQMIN